MSLPREFPQRARVVKRAERLLEDKGYRDSIRGARNAWNASNPGWELHGTGRWRQAEYLRTPTGWPPEWSQLALRYASGDHSEATWLHITKLSKLRETTEPLTIRYWPDENFPTLKSLPEDPLRPFAEACLTYEMDWLEPSEIIPRLGFAPRRSLRSPERLEDALRSLVTLLERVESNDEGLPNFAVMGALAKLRVDLACPRGEALSDLLAGKVWDDPGFLYMPLPVELIPSDWDGAREEVIRQATAPVQGDFLALRVAELQREGLTHKQIDFELGLGSKGSQRLLKRGKSMLPVQPPRSSRETRSADSGKK